MVDYLKRLIDLKPTKPFLIAMDSDGCVFDAMGIKQRECFCPWMIACFGLQPVAEAARECKEFADLFSRTRGANRHKTIVRILTELLPSHPKVKEMGFDVPKFEHYCNWVNTPGSVLSNDGLRKAITEAANPRQRAELQVALDWSLKVNQAVADIVKNVPPFNYVRQNMEKIIQKADVMVCSATPTEALEREWAEHNLAKYVNIIAGQEAGSKAEHLEIISNGKYANDKIIMLGDAIGDMQAAHDNHILFYPINPGNEAVSWKKFHDEAFDTFIGSQYSGSYEAYFIKEFEACLPENPSWIK